MESTLIDWLKARQAESGETDAEMAERLGMSRANWSHLRRGLNRSGPSLRLVNAAARAYPDRAAEVHRLALPACAVG